jgi:hypothetical protein
MAAARTISPKTLWIVAIPVSLLLCIPLVPLARILLKLFALDEQRAHAITGPICVFAYLYLLPKVLPYLGIQVRRRSVERFQAAHREDQPVALDLAIRIYQGQRFIWAMSAALFVAGVVLLMFTWFPTPGRQAPPMFTGLGLMLIGLILTRVKPDLSCEISEKGIRAPAGIWHRQILVPWNELVSCEIVHDEGMASDYFQLWDRSGRRRFNSRSWCISSEDRARIHRALRSKFVEKDKGEGSLELVWSSSSSLSSVWDRELDG